jgi:integrase
MEARGLTSKSVRTMFYGVKKWLEANDVDAKDLQGIDLPKSNITKTFDRAPTREELQKLLTYPSIRGRTVIEMAVSTGLRLSTLLSLRWKDITFEKEYIMINVQPEEGRKTTRAFFTFMTPEARNVLLEYKAFLERKGRKVDGENFVIANDKYKDERLTASSIQMFWERLLRTAGLAEKSHMYHVLHFHTLRKFFKTACTNAGCKREYTEFWMGHTGQGLDDSYNRFTIKEHLEEYRKAIPHLSITEAPTMLTRESLQKEIIRNMPDELLAPLAEKYNMSIERLRNVMALRGKKRDEETSEITNPTDFKKKKEPCENDKCQKLIEEKELETHIKDGWHFVATLPSGKILVSNE